MKKWMSVDGMSCRNAAKNLQQHLDGELHDERAEMLQRHLETCRECGLEADTYRELKAALSRQSSGLSSDTMASLRDFGNQLMAGNIDMEQAEGR